MPSSSIVHGSAASQARFSSPSRAACQRRMSKT